MKAYFRPILPTTNKSSYDFFLWWLLGLSTTRVFSLVLYFSGTLVCWFWYSGTRKLGCFFFSFIQEITFFTFQSATLRLRRGSDSSDFSSWTWIFSNTANGTPRWKTSMLLIWGFIFELQYSLSNLIQGSSSLLRFFFFLCLWCCCSWNQSFQWNAMAIMAMASNGTKHIGHIGWKESSNKILLTPQWVS